MPFNHFYCRHLFKVFFFCSALLIGFLNANAQNSASFSGYVKEANGPVSGASVKVIGSTIGTITNDIGFFKINGLKQGNYTIRISSVGFVTQEKQIRVKNEGVITVDFILTVDSKELKEVSIAGKTISGQLQESGFAVNAIDTKKFANTTADLNQVLSRTTGVHIREQGGLGSNFNFSINGLSGKQVKFFIDGIPMENFGSAMTLNNIPVNLAERVELYKGVVPTGLGSDAMGGAVNVITDQKTKRYLDLSHSYGSFNTHRSSFTGQYILKNTSLVFKGSGFFNYSDNDYLMRGIQLLEGVEVLPVGSYRKDVNGKGYISGNARRFHDHYRSMFGNVEAGFLNKKWADVLFVSFAYTKGDQDQQTGFDQETIYGNVTRKSKAISTSIRYKKDNFLTKGLNVNLFVAYSKDHYITADTLYRQYYWDGTWSDRFTSAEMGGIKTMGNIIRPRKFARVNASYIINDQHSFNFNYTVDRLKNESYNGLFTDADNMPGVLNKQIAGFTYQQELADKRLVNTFFGKFYSLGLEQKRYVNNNYQLKDTSFVNLGYGLASRYKLTSRLGIKASLEHAYRLQEVEEMFGDGLNVQPNPYLKPESSDNLNLGAYYGFSINKHRFRIEASGFYRNAVDFIYAVPDLRSGAVKNENKSSVRITGLETEVLYGYTDLFTLSANATYQNAINTTKFGNTESNVPEATYLNQIPNQPWFFANADFSIGKNDVFRKDSRFQFNWYAQYIQWFYLTWEHYGAVNGKSDIPTQLVHNISLSYSLNKGRYNISLESRNVTNELAYDNFRLQKPGRSFSIKLRYFIH